MFWLRIIFLLAALNITSAYRWRCYFACVDQTSTQNDYVEQRDRCRENAQLKVDMSLREAGAGTDDKARKAMLVSLFSQCMSNNGWTVPDGKGEGPKKADATPPNAVTSQAAIAAPPSAAAVAAAKTEEKSNLTRSAECAFARHSASVSSLAATRAEACNLECEQGLKMAPGAPRPPSCAPDHPAKLSKGNEQ